MKATTINFPVESKDGFGMIVMVKDEEYNS
jgi:hypothetical protein